MRACHHELSQQNKAEVKEREQRMATLLKEQRRYVLKYMVSL
jgi:hypothetical protein